MEQRTNIRRGMAVLSSDGVQLGRVIDVSTDAIVIEKGHFFHRDFRIPIDDIASIQGDEILLMRDQSALRKADSEVQAGTAEERRPRVSTPEPGTFPLPHEPPMAERRAAGPGWDPLSVDEEQEEAARTSGPEPKAPTRY